jgi:hypothetical protein
VDLKRPGRVDYKIPLFPTATPAEGFQLIRTIARTRQLELAEGDFLALEGVIPDLMTPGEVDSLLSDVRREVITERLAPVEVLRRRFAHYLKPVPVELILEQVRLAVRECSKAEFIPERFRPKPAA